MNTTNQPTSQTSQQPTHQQTEPTNQPTSQTNQPTKPSTINQLNQSINLINQPTNHPTKQMTQDVYFRSAITRLPSGSPSIPAFAHIAGLSNRHLKL